MIIVLCRELGVNFEFDSLQMAAGPALKAGTANVVSCRWARESVKSRETSPQLLSCVV
jgi:hypothetical protein